VKIKKRPPGLADWEELFPELALLYGGITDLEAATAKAPEYVRYLVKAHTRGPFELYTEDLGVAIRERDNKLAAQDLEMADKCMDILHDHQDEVADWLWSLIR
jgi:hypothetical protein